MILKDLNPVWEREEHRDIPMTPDQYSTFCRGYCAAWEVLYEPISLGDGWHYIYGSDCLVKKFHYQMGLDGIFHLVEHYTTEKERGKDLLSKILMEGYFEPTLREVLIGRKMHILLVSFPKYARLTLERERKRVNAIIKILNETSADFVMFSDSVLRNTDYLDTIRALVKNKSVTALMEFKEKAGLIGNRMYLLQNGEITDLGYQLFSIPEDAALCGEALVESCENKYDSFHRQFTVGNKRFLVIQCGENNILKGSKGVAEFRLKDCPELEQRFETVLNDVDVVLNPVHTRWGRFGNFLTRIRKFSENNRYCFSCAQMEGNQLDTARMTPNHNTTHVAMLNSELIAPFYTNSDEEYLVQTFELA